MMISWFTGELVGFRTDYRNLGAPYKVQASGGPDLNKSTGNSAYT
jgi:hypothetical protein